MSRKSILIVIAIIIIGGLGYWIYQSTLTPEEEREEETKDELSILLENLKKIFTLSGMINFSRLVC